MTEKGKNVVPFERPAAYWAAKARKHYTPAKMPNAAKLMRKALENSKDPQPALELARIYYSMGCFTAAERLLLKALGMGGLSGPGCCLTAQCALEQEEEGLAQRALEISLRIDPWGEASDLAEDILEFHPWQNEDWIKRGERSACLCERARRRVAAGDMKDALAFAQKAWEKGRSCDAALLLGALQAVPEKQIPYFSFAAARSGSPLRARLLLCHAYLTAGKPKMALGQLLLCVPLCESLGQTEFFCAAAWEAGQPRLALSVIARRLREFPYSVDYLRLRYLTLKRMNREEEAFDCLQKMLEIDPEDASLKRYRRDENDLRMDDSRLVYLSVLAAPVLSAPRRLREGPLNRTLHLFALALQDDLKLEEIYFYLPPLWRRLTAREKQACDDQETDALLPLSVYLLLRAGKKEAASRLMASCPGGKRILRKIRRFDRLLIKE